MRSKNKRGGAWLEHTHTHTHTYTHTYTHTLYRSAHLFDLPSGVCVRVAASLDGAGAASLSDPSALRPDEGPNASRLAISLSTPSTMSSSSVWYDPTLRDIFAKRRVSLYAAADEEEPTPSTPPPPPPRPLRRGTEALVAEVLSERRCGGRCTSDTFVRQMHMQPADCIASTICLAGTASNTGPNTQRERENVFVCVCVFVCLFVCVKERNNALCVLTLLFDSPSLSLSPPPRLRHQQPPTWLPTASRQ